MRTIYYFSETELKAGYKRQVYTAHFQQQKNELESVRRGCVIRFFDGKFYSMQVDMEMCNTGIYHDKGNFREIPKAKFMEAYAKAQDFLTKKLLKDE